MCQSLRGLPREWMSAFVVRHVLSPRFDIEAKGAELVPSSLVARFVKAPLPRRYPQRPLGGWWAPSEALIDCS